GSTKVETLPKGWWLPGGGDLFRWLLFLPMVFIVAFVLRAIFVGASVFQRDIHFWKAKPGAFHPITMVNTWKEKLQGQNETRFRQVAVDIGFATGQLLIVAAVTIGVVALVAPILEAIF